MKCEVEELNLRNAFAQEPEACHDALMDAARSVKEEKQVRRKSVRIAWIAAAILAATMAVAVAAGSWLGWSDFVTLYGTNVPETAQRVMNETWNKHSFALGPVSFTTQELFCDGHIAMSSTTIAVADGDAALLCAEPGDAIGAIGENGRKTAERLGVAPETTWLEAAKQLGRRLYAVRAILELPPEIDAGSAMEEMLWNEDGSVTYFSMPELNGAASGEQVEMQMFLRVAEYDPTTGEEKERLTDRQPLSVYLEAPMETHTYDVEPVQDIMGYTLKRVETELSAAGLYIRSTVSAPADAGKEDIWMREYPEWMDAQGNPFPTGISLSASVDVQHWPDVTYTQMISVNAIPESMTMRLPDGGTVVLRR